MSICKREINASYQEPVKGNGLVCVFENPTWREKVLGRPVVGVTGCNLCILFRLLRSSVPTDKKKQYFRCRCCIVNGSREVYSSSRCRTNVDFANDVRQNTYLKKSLFNPDVQIIICFGQRALKAVHAIDGSGELRSKVIAVYHLGQKALSRIQIDSKKLVGVYQLSEELWRIGPLLVIAEYILSWLDGIRRTKFRDFVRNFSDYHKKMVSYDIAEQECCTCNQIGCCNRGFYR